MPKITQTELAQEFGITVLEMGKKLIELNLKDQKTLLATNYALKNKLAKNINYTKNNKEIKMVIWDEKIIKYINKKMRNNLDFLSNCLMGKIKELKRIENDDSKGYKIQEIEFDYVYEEFLLLYDKNKKNVEILKEFYLKLEKENLISYAENYDFFKDLKIILNNIHLNEKLQKKENIKEINKI